MKILDRNTNTDILFATKHSNMLMAIHFMPPSHRTRSHYVPKIVAKRTQTVFELNGRSSNLLQSVYELLGRARTGRSKFFAVHAVL